MIRLVTPKDAMPTADEECLIRIRSLIVIYGFHVPFLQVYTDEKGTFMSIMDGVAILYTCDKLSEEWLAFLAFHADILRIHTNRQAGEQLARSGGWSHTAGTVLVYKGEDVVPNLPICMNPYLPDVYMLLAENFSHFAPFNAWYVDYSHRVRHGHCHVAAVMDEGKPVSVASTVAEVGEAAILGQVATHSAYRRRGYAATCLRALIHRLQGKRLYILPVDNYAEKLYTELGFSACGHWSELERYDQEESR